MEVQFADIKRQYHSIKDEMDKAIFEVIENTAFIGGSGNKYVTSFEEGFAKFLGQKNFVACANGTDSIEMILKAAGIGNGDEVIVPSHSWISTSEAVSAIGAKPVFVDITETTFTIDPQLIEEKISHKTKAIIVVHLYGCPADMDSIMGIAKKHNLFVLEDCAQAHGALYKNQMIGTIGHASSFSFYPGKNLGAYGDAGGVGSSDEKLLETVRMIANHGQLKKHHHKLEGRNSRLDGIQAAVLNVKLKYLNKWNNTRQELAKAYNELFKDQNSIITPLQPSYAEHVFHLYVIRTQKRELLIDFLSKNNIHTSIHYPNPLPFLEPYNKSGENKPEDFPVAYKVKDQILSIPMFPELTIDELNFVANKIKSFHLQPAHI
jgi:dTDP-4-amino-4,6-dideoxygalactose transaminase